MKLRSAAAIVFCALFSGALQAAAQSTASATLRGTVTDQSGAVIPGAEVSVLNLDTGHEVRLRTNPDGDYMVTPLPPGRYRLRVSAPGFAEAVHPGLALAVRQTATLNLRLQVGPRTEQLTVTVPPSQLALDNAEISSLVAELSVRSLPINGRRWEDFALLTPAVSEDGGFGLVSFRGLSGLYNNTLVDGADNNQAFFSESRGRTRPPYIFSSASIKEFQVITQNYSAEFGRAAGGVVNAVTRSGGNEMHGEAFYFVRTRGMLAQDPLAKARGEPKPDELRQQSGFALGGPVRRDRLFLFGSYDHQARDFPLTVVPRDANFAAACTVPECRPALAFIDGLLGVRPRRGDQDVLLLRPDWNLNVQHRLSGVFNLHRWRSPNGILRDPVLNDAVEAQGRDEARTEFLTVALNSTFSPAISNEFRFQTGRDFETQKQNTSGPLLDLTGFRAIRAGMREFLPRAAFPNEKRFQWMDHFTWVKGRHLLKVGADVNYVRDTVRQVFRGGGIYRWRTVNDFARDFAGTCAVNGGRCYRDFAQAVDPITGDGSGSFTTTDWNFYAQDSFQANDSLLLSLGLRYELQAMPRPHRPNPLVPANARLNTDRNNVAPRIALAWQPGALPSSVVRAGYGLFYGRIPNSTLFTHLFQNGVSQQGFSFLPTNCAAPFFPNVVFPPPSTAPLGPPAPGLPTPSVQSPPPGCAIDPARATVTTLAPDFVNPLVHQADLGIEMELGRDWRVAATYLMSRANRLPVFLDANVAPSTTTVTYEIAGEDGRRLQTVELPLYTARLDDRLGVVQTGQSSVNAWYHALVLEVQKRLSHGFQLRAHLTVAKATDNGVLPGALGTFSGTLIPVNPFDLGREHALSDLDVRRRFVLHAYWELPWKNSRSQLGRALADDWTLSTIGQVRDGNPLSAFDFGSPACSVNGGLTCGSADPFGVPAFTHRAPHLGRNIFYGERSGLATVDLRLGRNIPLGEDRRLELFWEAFNLFNRTHFTSHNSRAFEFVRPGASGATTGLPCEAEAGIAGCLFPLPGFLEPELSGTRLVGARQMQLGVRLIF